jgi:hypothetical protein
LEVLAGKADRDGKGFATIHDAHEYVTNGIKLWTSQHNVIQTPTLQCKMAGIIILARYS